MQVVYRRIMLKLSGEALGVEGKLFSHEKFEETANILLKIQKMGLQVAVVIGGGNVWRGRRGPSTRMGTVAADQMGMLGTLQNCLYMRDTVERIGGQAVVMSAVEIPRFAETYNTVTAIRHLEAGRMIFLACGLGNPCFSTDSAVALRAIELECDAVLMAKNIDGVYSDDPRKNPEAELLPDITYQEAVDRDLQVMDSAAFYMLRDNRVPMVRVFGLEPPENLIKVIQGDPMGSFVHP